MMYKANVVIIGGGPSGLGAACRAKELGIEKVLILERDRELGGLLFQCIHNGFGLQYFNEDLTGPEYATKFIQKTNKLGVELKLNTMVLEINNHKQILAVNSNDGLMEINTETIILAMGCRERTRGALNIPGTRPAGIFTAGTAQRLINMENLLPGKSVVILGSGDIGLIMARRLTWVGAKVKAIVEMLPYPSGLIRNVVQCVEDYDIPLILSHTVTNIHGKKRITGVTIAEVNNKGNIIEKSEKYIPCDTLLLSVGLIPENELSKKTGVELDADTNGPFVNQYMQTTIPNIFACGNVTQVYDLVDHVTEAGEVAAEGAYLYMKGTTNSKIILIRKGRNVRQIVPQRISLYKKLKPIKFFIRVQYPEEKVKVGIYREGKEIFSKKQLVVRPSEMIVLEVSDKVIRKASGTDEVTIKINGYGR